MVVNWVPLWGKISRFEKRVGKKHLKSVKNKNEPLKYTWKIL
jgi:hypothetical protein